MATVIVDGSSLDVGDVVAVARAGARVEVAPSAFERMARTRALVERVVQRGDSVYGLTTGVGVRKRVSLAGDEIAGFNRRIIAEHRTAHGADAPGDVVRATMLRLLNGFARGGAGVRPVLAERLVDALNRDEQPRMRTLGSTGQGDLMQLADLAAAVFRDVELEAKEGHALLSNNAFSSAWAALAIADTRTLLDAMTLAAALDLEAFAANLTPLHDAVGKARPYPGLVEELRRLRSALEGSEPLAGRRRPGTCRTRSASAARPRSSAPRETRWRFAEAQVAIELNASQENPMTVLAEDRIISAANYESLPLAQALDVMRIGLIPAITAANERLVKLLQSPLTGLGDGLHAPGVPEESGLSEYTWPAQSLALEARLLGQPVSLEIPSASQAEGIEDRASMAPLAARRLSELVDLGRGVVAIELVVAAQAVELRHGAAPDAIGVGARRAFDEIRRRVPFTGAGQTLASDLDPVRLLIADGVLRPDVPLLEIRDPAGRAGRRRRAPDAAAGRLRDRGADPRQRAHPTAHADPRRAVGRAPGVDRAEGRARIAHRRRGARDGGSARRCTSAGSRLPPTCRAWASAHGWWRRSRLTTPTASTRSRCSRGTSAPRTSGCTSGSDTA